MNEVRLLGRLGKDPEIRKTQSGKPVCNFSLATKDGYGDKATTTWHNIVTWEKTAENCAKYLRKGSRALVGGRIQKREYEDKQGAKREAFEIVAQWVEFVDSAPKDGAQPSTAAAPTEVDPPALDEIPF